MGFLRTLRTVWSKLQARWLTRRIVASWFSGSATLNRIAPLPGPQAGFSLLYRNGRRVALDESGILNPPDPGVGRFDFGTDEWDHRLSEGSQPDSLDLQERFDHTVMKSLLRHIRHPSDDPRQRDFAAQAITLIWKAALNRRNGRSGRTPWTNYATAEGFLGAGSCRETAPLR